MRSIVYDRHGDPADVLRVADVADPPRPGPGQVLIRVLARTIHPGDLASIRGTQGPDGTVAEALAPAIPGSDGMGVVEAVGAPTARDGVAVGRRVSFFPGQGSWAERVLAPIEGVVPTPDQVPDSVASLTLVNPLTAQVLLAAADHTSRADDVLLATAAGSSRATTGADLLGQGHWCGDGLPAPGQPPLAAAPKSLATYSADV